MKKRLRLIAAIFQLSILIAVPTFLYAGFRYHLRGNGVWLETLAQAKDFRESRLMHNLLAPGYASLESLHFLSSSPNDSMRIFEFKQRGKIPLLATRIQREIPCATCGTLDFLLVTDLRGTVQKINLITPIQADGKKVDASLFLKQFEWRSFKLPIQIGKDVEVLKEAPSYSGALIEAVSDALQFIQTQKSLCHF